MQNGTFFQANAITPSKIVVILIDVSLIPALEVPSIFYHPASRYGRPLSFKPQRLMSYPQTGSYSLRHSPNPGPQHLGQVVSQWERLLKNTSIMASACEFSLDRDCDDDLTLLDSPQTPISLQNKFLISSAGKRRPLDQLSLNLDPNHSLTDSQVVTLDPLHGLSPTTDLDDMSQPENGVGNDEVVSATDSDSEEETKEDENADVIKETEYVSNENEVLGTVRIDM